MIIDKRKTTAIAPHRLEWFRSLPEAKRKEWRLKCMILTRGEDVLITSWSLRKRGDRMGEFRDLAPEYGWRPNSILSIPLDRIPAAG
jgi:hypothetical protein